MYNNKYRQLLKSLNLNKGIENATKHKLEFNAGMSWVMSCFIQVLIQRWGKPTAIEAGFGI
jgi:hypothetical protein